MSFSIRLAISSAASHPWASAPNIIQLCQWWRASLVPAVSGDKSFDGLPLHLPIRAWSSLQVVSLTLSQCAMRSSQRLNLRDAAMAVLGFEQAASGSNQLQHNRKPARQEIPQSHAESRYAKYIVRDFIRDYILYLYHDQQARARTCSIIMHHHCWYATATCYWLRVPSCYKLHTLNHTDILRHDPLLTKRSP